MGRESLSMVLVTLLLLASVSMFYYRPSQSAGLPRRGFTSSLTVPPEQGARATCYRLGRALWGGGVFFKSP